MSERSQVRGPGLRGFTLLEVLVAVAILGIALVSLLALQARDVRLTAESQDITIAGLLASRLVVATQTEGLIELGSTTGSFLTDDSFDAASQPTYGGPLAEGFKWTREITATALPGLRQVRITVERGDGPTLAELVFLLRGQR